MNPNQKIKNLIRQEIPKSFPSPKEIEVLPLIKKLNNKGEIIEVPDVSKLEPETVGNIILNSLFNYIVKDKKEGYYLTIIAQLILSSDGEIEFKDKLKNFLVDVLNNQMLRREMEVDEKGIEKEVVKGLYASWAIIQVLEELGVKNTEDLEN